MVRVIYPLGTGSIVMVIFCSIILVISIVACILIEKKGKREKAIEKGFVQKCMGGYNEK